MTGTVRTIIAAVALAAGVWADESPPDVQWVRRFSGVGYAQGFDVRQTSDHGYIAVGQTWIGDTWSDLYAVKTDSLGNTQWEKTYGGPGDDQAYGVCLTGDGGFALVGTADAPYAGPPPGGCAYVVKADSLGNLQWQMAYDSAVFGYSVVQTADGGFAVAAIMPVRDTGLRLLKTDSVGNLQWYRSLPVSYNTWTEYVQVVQTVDHGYILGAMTLIKTDSLGTIQWSRSYEHAGEARSVIQMPDKGYVVTGAGYFGTISSPGDSSDLYLLRTDSLGNLIWHRSFYRRRWNEGYSVSRTQDGGFVVAGETDDRSPTGTRLGTWGWVIRTDAAGNELWSKILNTDSVFTARSVQQTADGGYIVVGISAGYPGDDRVNCLYLLKLSAERGERRRKK